MSLMAALSVLTICPVRTRRPFRAAELRGSLGWFPVVGLLIGLLLILVRRLAGLIFQREWLVAGLHAHAMAGRALEDTVGYVRERQAFGGPLADKQVVRHKLADLATQIEAGRWLTYAACQKYQAGEEAVREISMVKLFTAEMANRVAYDCVQLHGGYGYMREYPIERFARDVRLMTIGGGTSEIMKEIIAKALIP